MFSKSTTAKRTLVIDVELVPRRGGQRVVGAECLVLGDAQSGQHDRVGSEGGYLNITLDGNSPITEGIVTVWPRPAKMSQFQMQKLFTRS